MADFSATEVALSGFRFVKSHPRMLLVWTGVQLLFSLLTSVLIVLLFGPQLQKITAMQGQGTDLTQLQTMMAFWLPFEGLMLLLMLVLYAVLLALFSRAVLRPADDRYGYLRFGRDELRQGLLLLLMFAVGLGAEVVGVVAAVILGVIAAFAGHAVAGMAIFLAFVVVFCALIFFSVRLSLAPPLTFDTARVDLFGSWKLTRGRFWKMFGTYLLAGALGCLVVMLTMIAGLALAALVGGGMGAFHAILRPDMTLAGFFSLPRLVLSVVGAFGSALMWPVMMMPAPEIYAAISGSRAESPVAPISP